MCMDWKWFLQIREPTRICARVPPGAPAPPGPDSLCCRDRWGNSWREGGGQARCPWGVG